MFLMRRLLVIVGFLVAATFENPVVPQEARVSNRVASGLGFVCSTIHRVVATMPAVRLNITNLINEIFSSSDANFASKILNSTRFGAFLVGRWAVIVFEQIFFGLRFGIFQLTQ